MKRTHIDAPLAAKLVETCKYLLLISLLAGVLTAIQAQQATYRGAFTAQPMPIAASPMPLEAAGMAPSREVVTPPILKVAASIPNESTMSESALLNRFQPFIREASHRFAIPEDWIRTVIRMESGGRTMLLGKPITSSAGAMGVMQLMQQTYQEMRERHGLGPDPYDVRDNILAGTAYLRDLYKRFGYPRLFAAYNAGPGRFDNRLKNGSALPDETRVYLRLATRDTVEPAAAISVTLP